MKYELIPILLLIIAIVVTACAKNNKKDNKVIKGNELLIEYSNSPQELANSTFIIKIYDNRVVEYGEKEDKKKKINTNEELFNEIVDLAYSKNISKLEVKDISNKNVLDGYYTYITIYNEDNTSIRIGGSNPSNKYFDKLEKLINDSIKEE